MSELGRHLEACLRLRRALGFRLEFPGLVLPSLIGYLEAAGAATITAELAISWAGLPRGVLPITWAHRLGAARGFARYLKTIDPATEVPPAGIWPSVSRRSRPFIWAEADIRRLLPATRELRQPLRAASYETLFGLLAATGLRLGEAIGLLPASREHFRHAILHVSGRLSCTEESPHTWRHDAGSVSVLRRFGPSPSSGYRPLLLFAERRGSCECRDFAAGDRNVSRLLGSDSVPAMPSFPVPVPPPGSR